MKYLIESLRQLTEANATVALREVMKEFGAGSAASVVTNDNARDVSIRAVDNLVRHSLKMGLMRPSSAVKDIPAAALLGRIRSLDPITDLDSAMDATKKLNKTITRFYDKDGNLTSDAGNAVSAVDASVRALRSLRTMLRKNPDAATASVNALSSDIAGLARSVGSLSKSPRHVKAALVSAATGDPLPSEEGGAEDVPQMEAKERDDVFFLDSRGNVWETCSPNDKDAVNFGPRGSARKVPRSAYKKYVEVGTEDDWTIVDLK